eukprot:SAG31_NODE_40803_length_279_cov_0.572222_1_plen_62_part_10
MDYAPWPQTNGLALFAGNTIDGSPATASDIVYVQAKNVNLTDIVVPTRTKSLLTAETRFLKS